MLPYLTTPRLRLRICEPADAEDLWELFDDPVTTRHVGTHAVWGRETLPARLATCLDDYRRDGFASYTVSSADHDTVMGLCGLASNEDDTPELACILGRAYWRNGYCREALTAVLAHVQAPAGPPLIAARMELDHPSLPFMERDVLRPNGFFVHREAPHPHSNKPMRHYQWIREETGQYAVGRGGCVAQRYSQGAQVPLVDRCGGAEPGQHGP